MPVEMETTKKLTAGGRVVIPVKFRRTLGLKTGDEVIFRLENGRVLLLSREQTRQWAQDYVCRLIPPDVDLADELIRERREEVARD